MKRFVTVMVLFVKGLIECSSHTSLHLSALCVSQEKQLKDSLFLHVASASLTKPLILSLFLLDSMSRCRRQTRLT